MRALQRNKTNRLCWIGDVCVRVRACVCMCVCVCVYGGGLVGKSCPTLATPWSISCQAPMSMGFPRQEYWSGLLFPPPGDLSDQGIEPESPALPALQVNTLPTEPLGKPKYCDSAQFSLVVHSCPTLCDPMYRSTPNLPVHHQLPEYTQTHVH